MDRYRHDRIKSLILRMIECEDDGDDVLLCLTELAGDIVKTMFRIHLKDKNGFTLSKSEYLKRKSDVYTLLFKKNIELEEE